MKHSAISRVRGVGVPRVARAGGGFIGWCRPIFYNSCDIYPDFDDLYMWPFDPWLVVYRYDEIYDLCMTDGLTGDMVQ